MYSFTDRAILHYKVVYIACTSSKECILCNDYTNICIVLLYCMYVYVCILM